MSEQMLEVLAERQWKRMTRSNVPYSDLPDGDKRACRALVSAVLTDLRDLGAQADPHSDRDPWSPLLTDAYDVADLMSDERPDPSQQGQP